MLFIIITLVTAGVARAQAPRLLNYQAVVRNTQGAPEVNTPVRLQFIIHQNSPTGAAVFTETQTTQTNGFGLVTARIGDSIALVLNWSDYYNYLEVDADVNHTGTFTSLGTTQVVSVPLAILADTALNAYYATNAIPSDATNGYLTMISNDSLANSIITQNANGVTINGNLTEQSLWVSSNYPYNAAVIAARPGPIGYIGSFNDSMSLDVGTTSNSTGNLNLVTGTAPRVIIDPNGYVGINSAPVPPLRLTVGGSTLIDSNATILGNTLIAGNTSIGGGAYIAGKVGIGVAYPYAPLEVSGQITIDSAAGGANLYLNNPNTASASLYILAEEADLILNGASGTTGFTISDADGAVEPFYGNVIDLGSAGALWQNVWSLDGTIQTSDGRKKKNIQNLNLGLDAVMQLRPVSYEWINPKDGAGQKTGFIAQEVEKVIPQAVVHTQFTEQQLKAMQAAKKPVPEITDPYGMNYSELIPVIIKAMQEQQKLIQTQQQTIEDLKKEMEQLNRLITSK